MNPRLFLALVYGGALIGLPLGFLHQVWWLFVPPIAFGAYFFGSVIYADAIRRQYGGTSSLMPSMLLPNLAVN
jgi:hypothetical protein